MKLKEYIQKVGEQELADKMNVSKNTFISWRYGARQPSVKQAKKLISMTGRALDWEDIYGPVNLQKDPVAVSDEL